MHKKKLSSAVFSTLRSCAVGGLIVLLSITGVNLVSAAAGQILKVQTSDNGSTFYVGRCFRMDIRAQTDTLDANSVDVIIPYNTSYLSPYTNSGCTVVATAVNTNGAFPSYPANSISAGRIEFTGYDPSGTSPLDTGAAPADRVVAHVFWKVLAVSGAYKIPFDFTLTDTTDTNMAENNGDGSDVLDDVETLTLNLSADGAPPTFTSLSPANGTSNVSITSDLSYVFSDAGAGVNTGSLATKVNDTVYNETFSSCTRTNSNRRPQCNVAVNLPTLSYNTLYRVTATGADVAFPTANTGSQFWTFTTEDDDDAPYVENRNPDTGATGVAVSSNIVFRIKDYKNNGGVVAGLGVDIATVQVTVDDGVTSTTYDSSDPEFTYSGTSENYLVTINPASNFAENTTVTVTVNGADLHSPPNTMSADTYSFTTVDTGGPTLSNFSPAQSATSVAVNTNVSFRVTDNGAGVDLANTSITIEGVVYTSASGQWTNTGSLNDYTITINPSANFSGGQVVDVSISTRDLASPTPNTSSASYSFTIATTCVTCFVDSEDPSRFTTSATLDDTISFRVKDTGSGIDDDSLNIVIIGTGSAVTSSPLRLTNASPQVSVSGGPSNYLVDITLLSSIEPNIPYSIMIDASDVDSLDMSTVAYTFIKLTGSGTTTIINTTTNICPAPETDDGQSGQGGGGRRTIRPEVPLLPSSQLPTIIERRRIPQFDRTVERVLTPEEAGDIKECYVDGEVHEAAPKTPYGDIDAGVWYEDAIEFLMQKNALDISQPLFRGGDHALRAEFAKLLVALNGDPYVTPAIPSFDDAPSDSWFYPYVEEAGKQGWMKGYNDCYGRMPCMTMPLQTTTRAEAVAMIVRYHGMEPNGMSSAFADISADAWYADEIAIAADHCVVQGDALTQLAAPGRLITRAEMATMLYRAEKNLTYGVDCGTSPILHPLAASLLSFSDAATEIQPMTGSLLSVAKTGIQGMTVLGILAATVLLAYLGKLAGLKEKAPKNDPKDD